VFYPLYIGLFKDEYENLGVANIRGEEQIRDRRAALLALSVIMIFIQFA
jgi:hypothetical protein